MRLDALDGREVSAGLLHRLDARLKLVAALVFVVLAVATPIGSWNWFGIEGFVLALLVGLAGIPPRDLARRYFTFLVLVGFLALLVALTHPARAVWARGGLPQHPDQEQPGHRGDVVLAGVTSFQAILGACGRSACRRCWWRRCGFMERYRYVLADELDRMATARRRVHSSASGRFR